MVDRDVATAQSDARIWQADARNRFVDPPSPEEVDLAKLDQLCRSCRREGR